jgi:hypothetical protein
MKYITRYLKTDALFLLAFFSLVLIAAFFKNLSVDAQNYIGAIRLFAEDGIIDLLNKEPTFFAIIYISKVIFNEYILGVFIIYALLGVGLKLYAIRTLSYLPVLSLCIYIYIYFILHELTEIRVGVASAIFLLALPDIVNKNFRLYLIKTIIAALFHYSAIIMIFAYFINVRNKQQIFYLLLPMAGIIFYLADFGRYFLSSSISILPYFMSYKIKLYLDLLQQGVLTEINVFNLYYSSLLVIYYFFVVNINMLKRQLDLLEIKVMGWAIFSFYMFASVPVFAFRISEFFLIVVILILPFFVLVIKQKRIAYIIIIAYSSMMLINYIFINSANILLI